uniref:Reverse transcriptase domain-containing protein n=1 Tax=Tanacetum cinerariifolium TaxID=118510 RepID=A0A6L2P2C2_TANCI|nr:reverse transcriptase domain-containing protein [Tanacetum cinerariifolium]
MSSPNHHTSNIEDAFSSNFPDYIPASSNYVLASPGKTYFSSSNNSFGLVPVASPALLLFHDDPYIKFMYAYYAKESPIPLPVILPLSPMLSPMFNPQEFFLPEELLPPKKCGRDRSSSSTPTLPQEFEIGESSRKISLERHEEQIKEILNHLDELSLNRIENIEDNIEDLRKGRVIIQQDFDNLETELQETHAQVAKLQRKQLGQNNKIALAHFRINDLKKIIMEIQAQCLPKGSAFAASAFDVPPMNQAAIRQLVVDSVAAALEAQAANMENTKNTNRNPKPREAPQLYRRLQGKVATGTLTKEALSWWNSFAQPIGIEEAYMLSWVEFKKLSIKKYCPRTEELETLCPTMVLDFEKMMEDFTEGLPQSIEGNVTASKPQTLDEAINIAQRLMDQCRKTTNNNSQGRSYMLRDRNAHRDPNVVTEDKRMENIPVVREFLDVFPEDLPGLPPVCQVEFQIDLIPRATPIARAPYRLAPLEMQELSD